MTEAKAELPAGVSRTPAVSGDIDLGVQAERQNIGKQLHQGILQELTVAGLRLRGLQQAAPEPTATAIAEFAAWLVERQAELRRIVSDLEQGRTADGRIDLAAIAANLRERYGCRMTFDPQLAPREFGPGIWSALIDTVSGIAPILAEAFAARHIDIGLAGNLQLTLRIAHDGRGLAANGERLAAVRTLVGRAGASLQIDRQDGNERLTLDWTS